MTRTLNRHLANGANTTILRELAQLIGATATQVRGACPRIAPARASNPARFGGVDAGRRAAGAA